MASVAHRQGIDVADIEIWFEDEARIGQKNKITRRWARRGSRPSAPSDQRTASAYIFGAICPAQGKAVGLVLPWCNTEAMNLQLTAVSAKVEPGRHAVLLLDQAGWHMTTKLAVPGNITIVPLPAKCPELTWGDQIQGNSCLRRHSFVLRRQYQIRGPSHSTRRGSLPSSIKLTYGPRQNKRGTNIPPTAGKARVGQDHSQPRLVRPSSGFGRPTRICRD